MDSLDGRSEYDWSKLKPSEPDNYQDYVFFAHIIVSVIISVLSFSEGLFLWGVGTGALTPILLSGTGLFYALPAGINWYRDEFIPFLNRTQMIPEFETDGFLKYKRISRLTALIGGYLATAISQIVWYEGASFALAIIGQNSALVELVFYAFFAMIVFFLIIMTFLIDLFDYILKLIFSDVRYLIEIEGKMKEHFNKKKKDDKEKNTKDDENEKSE
ncbi:MAG: hypothetical protein KGD60_09260 [Candidatus Thorarchaeota archaeon]|nr:hypothetical protein [Candidatus Thorarchaeota archaeon]